MTALLGISQQDPRRLGESLWMSSTTSSSRSWAEQEERASGRMKAFAGIALAAPARVPGVMGALPWDPSRLSPSTGRFGPGEMEEDKLCQHRPRPWAAATMDKDMGSVASVDQHELISFLDDTDTDADEFILCSSNNSSPSSVPIAHFPIDENEIDRDLSSTRTTRSTSTDIISNSIRNHTSFYSSARSSFSSSTTTTATNLTFTTTSVSTATTTTATMAPTTITNSFLSIGGGDNNAAKSNGKKTAVATAETAAGGRSSEDSVDRSHGLWNYLHHGLDGYSSPDLRLLQHNQQQQQQSQQQHKQSPSSSSYHNLYLRPDSSRSHQHFHFPRTSSESGSRSGTGSTATATATANSTTWTLRSGKSHEKSNSSGSKKTTATTVSAANSATMAVKPTKVNTTGSATITVPPPPVSPSSSGPFGAQMTKQEFEALPEAIQRKVSKDILFV
ncbi:hypothetical protein CCUS01_13962 [Colletotrichum cuscutae]|uniref:Uncharacterized protein n=1 Tax=Colletotrichum cuscutae TaxID=1209917 RepID=A0AAI9YA94_9PEZI|nr:hypothetical protein CCUS01_13962 [Colletotrichum cuscutae]